MSESLFYRNGGSYINEPWPARKLSHGSQPKEAGEEIEGTVNGENTTFLLTPRGRLYFMWAGSWFRVASKGDTSDLVFNSYIEAF